MDISLWRKELESKYQHKAKQFICICSKIFDKDYKEQAVFYSIQYSIDTGDTIPIRQPPRNISLAQPETVSQIVKKMSGYGVAEPSASPWRSLVVLVKKKYDRL